VSGTVLLAAQGKIRGATVTGVEAQSYARVTDIAMYTTQQSLAVLDSTRYGILLGARLADDLRLKRGDQVLVILPVGALTPAGAVPRQRRFTVLDTFNSQSQLDSQTAFISLASARRLFRTGELVHGVQARLTDLFDTQSAREALYQGFGEQRVRVRSWMSTHGNLYQAIAVQKLTMFILLSFLVGVAAFNLVSGLMMIVEQRKNDVAILRTLGSRGASVMWLFCSLGVVLASSGIVAGVLAGVGIAWSLPYIYDGVSHAFGVDLMTQYFIAYLPVDVRVQDILQISGAALVLAIVATVYPARRAARMLPSRVLAHE
jgi:lipoprotein-releasing system permease protein